MALALVTSLLVGSFASANTITDVLARAGQQIVMNEDLPAALNFKKGDTANYNVDIGIIKGSMKMLVMDIVADGVWIQQLVDLGFAGKQDMQQLIDPNTGEIKKLIVNGKEQAPHKAGNVEVFDSKEDTVTVPAGTFTCLYIKAKVTTDGKASEAQQWINPKTVPVFGIVKMITESQLGPVTVELLSFKRM
ncbi:MAG: hypothetical protein ACK5P7_12130 [Bdellovibrio sp.]